MVRIIPTGNLCKLKIVTQLRKVHSIDFDLAWLWLLIWLLAELRLKIASRG